MRLFSTRTFAALLLSGSLFACTVGDTGAGRPSGADAGQGVIDNPDADPGVAELVWTPTTVDQTGLKAAFHYVSPTEIYAIVGLKICVWNGTAWADHTLDAPGLATTMHFVTPTQIYSVVGNKVCMWNGTAWVDMSLDVAGINDGLGSAAIHWVSDNEIYAVIAVAGLGAKICMYNGAAWVDMTEPMLGMKYSFAVGVTPGDFYAVVDTGIQKWTGLLGELGAWTVMSPPTDGLRPAIQVVSDLEMYAVIGDKVCKWNGTAWVDLTTDMTGLAAAFMHTADDNIMAVAGLAITHWAPEAL